MTSDYRPAWVKIRQQAERPEFWHGYDKCARCGAKANEPCKTGSGWVAGEPHAHRPLLPKVKHSRGIVYSMMEDCPTCHAPKGAACWVLGRETTVRPLPHKAREYTEDYLEPANLVRRLTYDLKGITDVTKKLDTYPVQIQELLASEGAHWITFDNRDMSRVVYQRVGW